MMLERRDDGGSVIVTFRIPGQAAAESACVVGDFNNWSEGVHVMSRVDGSLTIAIPLDAGRAYRFRYLLDGERWENDWAADTYLPNEFGGNDSVIDLTRAHFHGTNTRSDTQPAM